MTTATFNATTTDRPLWANAEGHPSIWIRWTAAHEEWVESEQQMAYRRLGTFGRIVECGPYGKWFIGDWRPECSAAIQTKVLCPYCQNPVVQRDIEAHIRRCPKR